MTDKRPYRSDDVEYVEAEPIGEESPVATPQPPPMTRNYYQAETTRGGCIPCCGPIGCATIMMLFLVLFGHSNFAQPLIYALLIFVAVSVIAKLLK